MSTLSVSLDLESVLADITTPFIDEYEERHGVRLDSDWSEWGFTDAEFDFGDFMEITTHNWKHHVEDIPPREPELSRKVFNLYQHVDRLDVVTGRRGVPDKIRAWLNTQGIIYDDLKVAEQGKSKAEYGYNVYIDDNPKLVPEVSSQMFLIDHPYNRDVDDTKHTNRVESIAEVTERLT